MVAKSLEGFSLCKYGSKISHLLFANDSLLFCRASVEDVSKILKIFGKHEGASGQKVNANKTTIFFGGNVTDSTKLQVQSLLSVPKIRSARNIWGCRRLWVDIKKKVLIILKIACGENYMVGRKNSYSKPGRRFC